MRTDVESLFNNIASFIINISVNDVYFESNIKKGDKIQIIFYSFFCRNGQDNPNIYMVV